MKVGRIVAERLLGLERRVGGRLGGVGGGGRRDEAVWRRGGEVTGRRAVRSVRLVEGGGGGVHWDAGARLVGSGRNADAAAGPAAGAAAAAGGDAVKGRCRDGRAVLEERTGGRRRRRDRGRERIAGGGETLQRRAGDEGRRVDVLRNAGPTDWNANMRRVEVTRDYTMPLI